MHAGDQRLVGNHLFEDASGDQRLVGNRLFGDASGALGGVRLPQPLERLSSTLNITAFRRGDQVPPELQALLDNIPELSAADRTALTITKEALGLAAGIVSIAGKGVGLVGGSIDLLIKGYKAVSDPYKLGLKIESFGYLKGYKTVADPYKLGLKIESFGYKLYDNQRKQNDRAFERWLSLESINAALEDGSLLSQMGAQFDNLQRVRRIMDGLSNQFGGAGAKK
eukprot:gene2387-8695_t